MPGFECGGGGCWTGSPPPFAGIRRRFFTSFSPRGPFNSLHWAASLPSSPHASPLQQHSVSHRLKSPSPSVRGGSRREGKKNQYNTKQWLIGLGVRCAERSLLYIMYGGRLMVSVLADKWTVSISPVCRSAGWRGEARAQALTQKADKRTRTYRPEMRVNKCLYAG